MIVWSVTSWKVIWKLHTCGLSHLVDLNFSEQAFWLWPLMPPELFEFHHCFQASCNGLSSHLPSALLATSFPCRYLCLWLHSSWVLTVLMVAWPKRSFGFFHHIFFFLLYLKDNYNVVLVSVIYQLGSAIGIPMSPSSHYILWKNPSKLFGLSNNRCGLSD